MGLVPDLPGDVLPGDHAPVVAALQQVSEGGAEYFHSIVIITNERVDEVI